MKLLALTARTTTNRSPLSTHQIRIQIAPRGISERLRGIHMRALHPLSVVSSPNPPHSVGLKAGKRSACGVGTLSL